MKGLAINKDILKQVPQKGFQLLTSYKDTVLMVQKIRKNRKLYLEPMEDQEAVELIYLLEGKMQYVDPDADTEVVLSKGDTCTIKGLEKGICIDIKEDCSFIYFTVQQSYNMIEDRIKAVEQQMNNIQVKDAYTADHCYRVAVYAELIAQNLKNIVYSPSDLSYAASMHDVGKCMIPDKVLLKQGRFTEEERLQMNAHPQYSAEILSENNGFNEHICHIVATHHERYDGTGYPNGLKGEAIPIEARVIAVADTFDAITSERPYQKARTIEEAIDEMMKYKHQFDPRVFEVFLNLAKTGQLAANQIPLIKDYKKMKS